MEAQNYLGAIRQDFSNPIHSDCEFCVLSKRTDDITRGGSEKSLQVLEPKVNSALDDFKNQPKLKLLIVIQSGCWSGSQLTNLCLNF